MTAEQWWKTGVIYQVYPRSFQDSNGDGVGDLRGVLRRLPYLAELGVDAVWLCPIFPSPMADFGYDIADYTDVDPSFGTMADFDALVEAAHARGLRIILDLVPNHTSDRHPWFKQSRSSRTNPKRDWYIWRDPGPNGGPPNNWLSEFGGSAWEYDSATQQYYYHTFLATQPDLNWRNAQVRAAIHEVMRFWFLRGVDGFRMDVIWRLIKDDQFRDNPKNPEFSFDQPPHRALIPLYTADRPEVHDVIGEMRRVADEFPGRVLIGEIYLPIDRLVAYYGRDLSGVHLPFNFALLSARWNARAIAKLIDEYEAALPSGGWPNWVLGNHDKPRIATRVGARQAPIAAMLLLTLRGTPTIYNGDEIGLEQAALAPHQLRDRAELNVPGRGLGRDGCRTPMQWDDTPNAGFSTAQPWLPVEPDYKTRNVAALQKDRTSIYHLCRRLLELRRSQTAFALGSYRPIEATGDLLLFVREHAGKRILVALNMGEQPTSASFQPGTLSGRVVLSSGADRHGENVSASIDLRSDEGLIIELSEHSSLPR